MKKRIHILTAEEHRKFMVDPDPDWVHECDDPKYRVKYFVALDPDFDEAPHVSKYRWPVIDTTGSKIWGEPAAYFRNREAADNWRKQENALHPPPPKPPIPQPLYPVGTYYAVETNYQRYEIRQIGPDFNPETKIPKRCIQQYLTWSEIAVSVHATKHEAIRELVKLVTKK